MNKRIQELAEQAGITTNLDTDFFEKDANKWVDYFAEKFAELIVKECAKVAFDDWCEGTNESSSEMAILKHFGVEE